MFRDSRSDTLGLDREPYGDAMLSAGKVVSDFASHAGSLVARARRQNPCEQPGNHPRFVQHHTCFGTGQRLTACSKGLTAAGLRAHALWGGDHGDRSRGSPSPGKAWIAHARGGGGLHSGSILLDFYWLSLSRPWATIHQSTLLSEY